MTTVDAITQAKGGQMPGTLRLGISRGGIELKQFFREIENVVFTFSFPALMLLLLGMVFTKQLENGAVSASQYLTAGMLGAGIMSASFLSLGISIAVERENGTLKRLRGTPMPASAYFIGKMILVLVTSIAEAILLLAVGVVVFDLQLPSSSEKWLNFGWILLLGVMGCSLLGIAISSLARSAKAATAVALLPFMVLQFISGLFVVPITILPDFVLDFASIFPLKWMSQGFRSVFLPDSMAAHEITGAWELDRVALVLALWCIAGLVLCLTTFRWKSRKDG